MVTVSGVVDMAVRNWPWLLLALGAFWYLRWWTEVNRRLLPWAGLPGKPPNPINTLFGAIRVEFDQNRRRFVAIAGFLFGGLLVVVNTLGFSLAMLTQLEPVTWASVVAAAFGFVGVLGFEPSLTVVVVAIVAAGAVAMVLRAVYRSRTRERT